MADYCYDKEYLMEAQRAEYWGNIIYNMSYVAGYQNGWQGVLYNAQMFGFDELEYKRGYDRAQMEMEITPYDPVHWPELSRPDYITDVVWEQEVTTEEGLSPSISTTYEVVEVEEVKQPPAPVVVMTKEMEAEAKADAMELVRRSRQHNKAKAQSFSIQAWHRRRVK